MTVAHVFRKCMQTLENDGWRCMSFSFKNCPQLVKHFGSIMAKSDPGLADPSTSCQIAGASSPHVHHDYGGRLHSQQESLVLPKEARNNNHGIQIAPAGSCHKADQFTPPTKALAVDSLPECESSCAVLHPQTSLEEMKIEPEDIDQLMPHLLRRGSERDPVAKDAHAVQGANQLPTSQCYKDQAPESSDMPIMPTEMLLSERSPALITYDAGPSQSEKTK